MRVLQIVPGSGGLFYCQNCQRDLELVRALRATGHDVMVMPLYLPLTAADEHQPYWTPVFYGAVSLYLSDRFPGLRHLPAWLWRTLDTHPVLRLAARQAGRTRASGLSSLTVSMLRGEMGRQAAELGRMIDWLRTDARSRPDIVCLSNSLLLGLAGALRRKLNVPVVCWLQDENVWPDSMTAGDAAEVWSAMRERIDDVDAFISVSDSFAALMSDRLQRSLGRVHTIYPGVDPSRYRVTRAGSHPPMIGYLARLSEAEGFGLFADAFLLLRRSDPRFARARLMATGGYPNDQRWLARCRQRLIRAGAGDDIHIDPEAFERDRAGFLAPLSVLSVPALNGEAFGNYLIEAMAAGVPVAQPRLGAFPEVLSRAGCGVLYEPNTPEALAQAWASLLGDPARCAEESRSGRLAVEQRFSLERMAREVMAVLADVIADRGDRSVARQVIGHEGESHRQRCLDNGKHSG